MGNIWINLYPIKKKQRGKPVKECETYPWEEIYEVIVGNFNMPPSEWRTMTPAEGMRLMDARRPKQIGHLSEDEYDSIEERRAELEAQGVTVG